MFNFVYCEDLLILDENNLEFRNLGLFVKNVFFCVEGKYKVLFLL